jgi:hypothetical protein
VKLQDELDVFDWRARQQTRAAVQWGEPLFGDVASNQMRCPL